MHFLSLDRDFLLLVNFILIFGTQVNFPVLLENVTSNKFLAKTLWKHSYWDLINWVVIVVTVVPGNTHRTKNMSPNCLGRLGAEINSTSSLYPHPTLLSNTTVLSLKHKWFPRLAWQQLIHTPAPQPQVFWITHWEFLSILKPGELNSGLRWVQWTLVTCQLPNSLMFNHETKLWITINVYFFPQTAKR